MTVGMSPPRCSVVDLALLLEKHLQEVGEHHRSGDQVMDLHPLKKELKEKEARMEEALGRVHLQGMYLSMTKPQKRALRQASLDLAGSCMHILEVCCLLDPENEL